MSGYVLEIASKPRGVVRRRKLSEDDLEALANAVLEVLDGYLKRHLAHAAEQRVREDLDEVIEVDCDALEAGKIAYIFHEHWVLGALCGYHWYTHALAASWDQIGALFAERGQKVTGRKPSIAREYGPQEGYALAPCGDGMLAVHPNGDAILSTGEAEDRVVPHDSEALGDDARRLAKALHDTGLCRCSLCEAARPAGVAGKPAARRRRPEPEEPDESEAEAPYLAALQAAERGDVATLDRLLASGENVNLEQCWEWGVRSPSAVTVKHLIERGHRPPPDAVADAARRGVIAALQLMRDAGANLEAPDNLGRNPLANAAMYGSVEGLRFLLEEGVAVDAVDQYHGYTALLWSISTENAAPEQIIPLLVAAGANVDARGSDGRGIAERLAYIRDEEQRAVFSQTLASAPRPARPGT
jgi:Ankyrin repeats (3 copies)